MHRRDQLAIARCRRARHGVGRACLVAVLFLAALAGRAVVADARQALPRFSHVFTIVLENHEYGAVMSARRGYFATLISRYGLATQYYATTHPSLPNYLALTGGSTFGFDGSDCSAGPDCHISGRNTNIADQLEAARHTWAAYMEGMPAPCTTQNAGTYAVRHNPFVYYDDIRNDIARCTAHVLPYGRAGFVRMLHSGHVPDYVWISPDLCDDGHDQCSTDPLAQTDTWLQANVPAILQSAAWQHGGVLFILWDEGTTDVGFGGSAGGHIVALVVAPMGRPGYRSTTQYTHYAYLRTVEDAWHLPRLGKAACSCVASMTDFFKP